MTTAMNIVRFRVKPGCQQRFIDVHREVRAHMPGGRGGQLVPTGERTFCMEGQWQSFEHLVIGILDQLRELLEDQDGGLGVTDPVSGEVVAAFGQP